MNPERAEPVGGGFRPGKRTGGAPNPNFTRFPIKLLILLDTTHFCSHNISLNFILDVDVGSGFSPNQRRKIHT
jgi:hypothetical protein